MRFFTCDVPELRECVDEGEGHGAFRGRTGEGVGYPAVEHDEAGVTLGLKESGWKRIVRFSPPVELNAAINRSELGYKGPDTHSPTYLAAVFIVASEIIMPIMPKKSGPTT